MTFSQEHSFLAFFTCYSTLCFMQKNILENTELSKKVAVLENTIDDLKHRLDVSETECENAHATINQLKNKLKSTIWLTKENNFNTNMMNK